MARLVMDSLIKYGKVDRGFLGVTIQNLTEDLAKSFGYEGTQGVLISDVNPDSPAAKAGLQAGDIILEYDGRAVDDVGHLRNAVAATAPGKQVHVEIVRDGKPKTITMNVGELAAHVEAARGAGSAAGLGISTQTLTPDMAKQLGDADLRGVEVTEVKPGSAADRAGIRAGDVIVSVGNKTITDTAGFQAAMRAHDLKQGVRLSIVSQGSRRFVFVKEKS
jgi:serine protease Do